MMGEFALVLSSCGFIFILIFGIGRFDSFVNNKLLLQQFNAIFLYCLFFFIIIGLQHLYIWLHIGLDYFDCVN